MKLKIIFIGLILSVFTFSACDDYVDIEPKRLAIAEDYKDVDALLNGATSLSSASPMHEAAQLINDNVIVSNVHLQDLNSNTYRRAAAGIYQLDDAFYLESETDGHWKGGYEIIANCNYILQILNELDQENPLNNQYRGEAQVHRAYAYWVLVNLYGHHFGTNHAANENSGIPILKKHADQTESLKRRTVQEVYDFIIEDLEFAVANLPIARQSIDRPHKGAAQALLARVYLHIGNYAKALEYADKALESNSHLHNYSQLSGAPGFLLDNEENLLMKRGIIPNIRVGWSYSNLLMMSKELEALYDVENDLRIINHSQKNSDGYYVYADHDPWSYYFELGVTVPEIMLIKAEALARDNSSWSTAIDVVNELRSNRFSEDAVSNDLHLLAATNQEEAIQNVLNERRREFHVTGMRFFDIKRLNALHDANISLNRNDKTWSANSINWALPITTKLIRTSGDVITSNPRE
jgi:tetratricopeptide (TPR) repeat protein